MKVSCATMRAPLAHAQSSVTYIDPRCSFTGDSDRVDAGTKPMLMLSGCVPASPRRSEYTSSELSRREAPPSPTPLAWSSMAPPGPMRPLTAPTEPRLCLSLALVVGKPPFRLSSSEPSSGVGAADPSSPASEYSI